MRYNRDMKEFLKQLFSESGGVSAMRVMAMMCCIAAVVIAIMGLSKPVIDYSGLSLICSTFLGAAMGGKLLQKRVEISGAKSDTSVEIKSNVDNPD
jgi:hypothetical protein